MLALFVIILSEDFELGFFTLEDAQNKLNDLKAIESPYRGLYGVSDETTLEVREVAYHFTTGGSPIRYFVD